MPSLYLVCPGWHCSQLQRNSHYSLPVPSSLASQWVLWIWDLFETCQRSETVYPLEIYVSYILEYIHLYIRTYSYVSYALCCKFKRGLARNGSVVSHDRPSSRLKMHPGSLCAGPRLKLFVFSWTWLYVRSWMKSWNHRYLLDLNGRSL